LTQTHSDSISYNLVEDPITYLVLKKWGIRGILVFFVIPSILVIFSSLYEGSFFIIDISIENSVELNSYIKDSGTWVVSILIFITSLFIKKLFDDAQYYFKRLWDRKIFEDSVNLSKYIKYLYEYEKQANSKLSYILGMLFVVIYLPLHITIIENDARKGIIFFYDYRYFPITRILVHLFASFYVFLIGIFLWKVYFIVKSMRGISNSKNFQLRLQPLNPDKSAGLHPLGKLSFYISRIILTFGLYVSYIISLGLARKTLYSSTLFIVIIMMIIYLSLSIFLFFYPILSAHNLMMKVKDNLLDKLSAKLGVMYSKMYDDLANTESKFDSEQTTQLLNLRELYLEAGKMPVWPFDTDTLLRFIGSVVSPIFLLIIEVFISVYLLSR